MAHSAATGSAKRTVDVIGKRLGIKKFGGEKVNPGEIIVRQRGSEFYPGVNVKQGRDFTLYATKLGFVAFRRMTGYKRHQKYVDVVESASAVVQGGEVKPTEIDVMPSTKVDTKPIIKKTSTVKKQVTKSAAKKTATKKTTTKK